MSESTAPTPPPPLVDGWVYFIRGGAYYKIGWSRDPGKRLEQFRTGCPFPIELVGKIPGTMADEKSLHAAFEHLRTKPPMGEWFSAAPELEALVRWALRYDGQYGQALVGLSQHAIKAQRQHEEAATRLDARLRKKNERAGGYSDRASGALKAIRAALREHIAEIERATDATDSHEGLANAMRAAGVALENALEGPPGRLRGSNFAGGALATLLDLACELAYMSGAVETGDGKRCLHEEDEVE